MVSLACSADRWPKRERVHAADCPQDRLEQVVTAMIADELPGARIEIELLDAPLDGDDHFLARTIATGSTTPALRIWQHRRALVVSRRLSRHPDFGAACRASEGRGWPVYVRPSGGTAVAVRPGILNVSLVTIAGVDPVRTAYLGLVQLLSNALARLGLETDAGFVTASSCDGEFNLRWNGRKLAGTAALVRRVNSHYWRLAHASLALYGDLATDLQAVERLERDLGLNRSYRAEAHASIAEALGETRLAV